jgi:hypothetical protein
MAADRESYFAPSKQTQQAKAAATDSVARMIVSAETAARIKKTAKLKELRLQQAQLAEDPETQSPKPKKKRSK